MGGKGKLLRLIRRLAPPWYPRFIDVFGGSGTVTLGRPLRKGCLEVYNDYNSNLTNLFCCVKNRTLALLKELGFLPLNSSPRGDVRRAADYFKLIRYSFSGGGKSFAGRSCDLRRFFYLIWECSRRLASVVIENKDFESLILQYDRKNAFFYCDPPYFEAESCYEVEFPKEDHQRLHDVLLNCQGYVMVSYNCCPYILELYQEFYIFYTTRPNSMSQTADNEYEELIITNYDPRKTEGDGRQLTLFPGWEEADEDDLHYELIHEPGLSA